MPPAPSRRDIPRTEAGSAWLRLAIAATGALVLLQLLWELWLAPVRPGGSWLALKALPLALLWPRVARGEFKARQYLVLLLLPYMAEAVVRALTEGGRHRLVAAAAATLATGAFTALLLAFRAGRNARRRRRPA